MLFFLAVEFSLLGIALIPFMTVIKEYVSNNRMAIKIAEIIFLEKINLKFLLSFNKGLKII